MYLNKGTAAMLVSPTNPLGIELYSSADILFWLKNMLICHIALGDQKKLCFTTLSLIPMVSIARLSVVKQSSFGLPGQYGRHVTRVN